MFVTFEGIDGVGKTTHINLAAEFLRGHGLTVFTTHQPGATEIGQFARKQVLENPDLCDAARLMLFLADRAEHCDKVIVPSLKTHNVVICDRYFDSTFAYQGYGQQMNLPLIRIANTLTNAPQPDITFLLDAPVQFVEERLDGNFFEDKRDLLARAKDGFITEMNESKRPSRWRWIDATRDKEAVATQIASELDQYLSQYKAH